MPLTTQSGSARLLRADLARTAEVFAPQLAALWSYGPTTVASTLARSAMTAIAASILEDAPPRFALVGISMGGYIALEIMRQAPERVIKLALLDTSARPDSEAQIGQRRKLVDDARSGDFGALATRALTAILHPARQTTQPSRR
ncbi:MAG: alpha/beta fold hydrolase [Devosia sp.]